jgi:general L-amino acid transport system permease protein
MTDEPRFMEPGLGEPLLIVDEPPAPKEVLTPTQWLRKRLFNTWYNSTVTLILVPLLAYLGWRFFAFIVFNARWDPVRNNLTLFMVGRFPRAEMWRVTAQVIIWSSAIGLAWGAAVAGAKARALRAGLPYREDPLLAKARRYWAILVILGLLLSMTRTLGPLFLVLVSLTSAAALQYFGSRAPADHVGYLWAGVAVLGVTGFQIVSGFYGNGWLWMGLPVAAAAAGFTRRHEWSNPMRARLVAVAAAAVVLVITYFAYQVLDQRGVPWHQWEGLRLNLLAAPIAIVLAFPLGIALALARRSSFPALRIVSTGYIELIRGVPLISLLLMGAFFIGFFLNTTTPLSSVTRAITVLTMFTAAYVAEIVRGGLQSIPKGQVEAGQSLGLSPLTVTRRIVLPQALRNVIPPMVGQFIALTKDTTLLYIIAVAELLYVRGLVHAQAEFRAFGHAETLVFVALIFWAITFSMSRESQRLERKLGVGER